MHNRKNFQLKSIECWCLFFCFAKLAALLSWNNALMFTFCAHDLSSAKLAYDIQCSRLCIIQLRWIKSLCVSWCCCCFLLLVLLSLDEAAITIFSAAFSNGSTSARAALAYYAISHWKGQSLPLSLLSSSVIYVQTRSLSVII